MRNVRSTPTPLEMRRTVICLSSPPLRTRNTVPSKFWTRSRLPSTTRTLTRTVSPGRTSGRSAFSCSEASVFNRSFIGMVGALTEPIDSNSSRGGAALASQSGALGLLQAIEDRHVRDAEMLRELAHRQPCRAHPGHLGDGRSALGAA